MAKNNLFRTLNSVALVSALLTSPTWAMEKEDSSPVMAKKQPDAEESVNGNNTVCVLNKSSRQKVLATNAIKKYLALSANEDEVGNCYSCAVSLHNWMINGGNEPRPM